MNPDTESAGNPRAFVSATGYLFQGVGLILTFSTCCLWSLSGCFQERLPDSVDLLSDYWKVETLPGTLAMLGMVVTFVAGLGLVGSGLGLQGERRSSGHWALAVTVPLAMVWWGRLLLDLWLGGGWARLLIDALVAILATVLFLFAGNSARLLRLHPPPPDLGVVSDEFLEEYSRRRPESRE